MSQWPPVPSLTLSSRSTSWLPARSIAAVARDAGTDGMDLDLATRSVVIAGLSREPCLDDSLAGTLDSLWLPLQRRPRCSEAQADRLVQGWISLTRRLDIHRVVIDRDAALRPMGDQDKRPLLLRLQEGIGPATRIAVVIRPGTLEGNRAHLAAMGSLRRTAEEWDFDLALDLFGPVDPRWEAEAALQRILSRLTLVRLGPVGQDGGAAGSRTSRRTLAWLLDQSYPGTLSLVPRTGWRGPMSAAALERRTRIEVRAIADRHQRIFASHLSTTRLASPQER